MKANTGIPVFFFMLYAINAFSQGIPPWNSPLRITWSTDGKIFDPPQLFQDSAGVPSLIRWHGDTLIAAFQWFRQPNPSPTWDQVATKFSYDHGLTWSQPTPIVINGLPPGFQRPFDPTLTVFNKDSIRIYFSSSKGKPMPGQDSIINTYSAKSGDGIHFYFEPNPRVDEPVNRVIDPAVIYFNTGWHYLAPVGAPQQGAFHYVSPNGLNFSAVPIIPSDNTHNWTGNYMLESSTELRFYGCGQNIWYNASPNGGLWSGYVNTNILGGDPTVLKVSNNNYVMVYVGPPLITGLDAEHPVNKPFQIYPNPASDNITVIAEKDGSRPPYFILDAAGRIIKEGHLQAAETKIHVADLPTGIYTIRLGENQSETFRIIKE